jgi:hypothetical protein
LPKPPPPSAFPFIEGFPYPNGPLTGQGLWQDHAGGTSLTVLFASALNQNAFLGENQALFGVDSWNYASTPFTLTVDFIVQTLITGTTVAWELLVAGTEDRLLKVESLGGDDYLITAHNAAPFAATLSNGTAHTLVMTYPGNGIAATVTTLDGTPIISNANAYTSNAPGSQEGIVLEFDQDQVTGMDIDTISITSP